MEEQLLCAVVHEFGPNFAFAADVLAACSQLQGIFRRASQCKEKFKQLTVGLAHVPASPYAAGTAIAGVSAPKLACCRHRQHKL